MNRQEASKEFIKTYNRLARMDGMSGMIFSEDVDITIFIKFVTTYDELNPYNSFVDVQMGLSYQYGAGPNTDYDFEGTIVEGVDELPAPPKQLPMGS